MADQPQPPQPQYNVSLAFRECLEDMRAIRSRLRGTNYKAKSAPLVETLIKLRNEALQLMVLQSRLVAAARQAAEAARKPVPVAGDEPGEPKPGEPEPAKTLKMPGKVN